MKDLNLDGLLFGSEIKDECIEITSNSSWENEHSMDYGDAVKLITHLERVFNIDSINNE